MSKCVTLPDINYRAVLKNGTQAEYPARYFNTCLAKPGFGGDFHFTRQLLERDWTGQKGFQKTRLVMEQRPCIIADGLIKLEDFRKNPAHAKTYQLILENDDIYVFDRIAVTATGQPRPIRQDMTVLDRKLNLLHAPSEEAEKIHALFKATAEFSCSMRSRRQNAYGLN